MAKPTSKISITPAMDYQFVAQAGKSPALRPIVIGFGPCGLFAALILAQAGFNPLIIEPLKNTRKLQYIGTYVKKSAIPSYLHNE